MYAIVRESDLTVTGVAGFEPSPEDLKARGEVAVRTDASEFPHLLAAERAGDGQIIVRLRAKSDEEAWEDLRATRDALMNAYEWRFRRHDREVALGIPTTWTDEQLLVAHRYMQALADLPAATTDPRNPTWPVPPA